MEDTGLTQEEIEVLLKGTKETLKESGPMDSPFAGEGRGANLDSGAESLKTTLEEPQPTPSKPFIKPADFEEFRSGSVAEEPISDMGVLLDIPLSISVELGKSRCYVKDLLSLTAGSIVELDRLAGDPVDILVNGKMFAKGEVVVIDENFGVRIREVLGKGKGHKHQGL